MFFSHCIYSWNRLSSFLIPLFLFVNHLLRNSSAFIEGSLTTWVKGNFEVFWLFSLQVEDNSRNSRQITLIFSKIPCFLEIIFMRLGNNYFLKSCPQLFILNSCPQLWGFGNSCPQLYLISLGTTSIKEVKLYSIKVCCFWVSDSQRETKESKKNEVDWAWLPRTSNM